MARGAQELLIRGAVECLVNQIWSPEMINRVGIHIKKPQDASHPGALS